MADIDETYETKEAPPVVPAPAPAHAAPQAAPEPQRAAPTEAQAHTETEAPAQPAADDDEAAAEGTESSGQNPLGMIYSTRRPQNVLSGLSSGGKNLGRGLAAGTASLVAMPVAGAKSGGAIGALKGLGLGAVAFAALSIGGVATCGVQVVRGVINTPEAVKEAVVDEKVWDTHSREWVEVRLAMMHDALPSTDDDILTAARVRALSQGKTAENPFAAARPPDAAEAPAPAVDFYEQLEVSRTASGSEVKRAYAKMALKHHPDKNQNDPAAADRFRNVNRAYKVLSNPITRAEFDNTGRVDDGSGAVADGESKPKHTDATNPSPMPFLQDFVGGEAYLPLIGPLSFGVFFMNERFTFTDTERVAWFRRREIRCAHNLARLLDRAAHHGFVRPVAEAEHAAEYQSTGEGEQPAEAVVQDAAESEVPDVEPVKEAAPVPPPPRMVQCPADDAAAQPSPAALAALQETVSDLRCAPGAADLCPVLAKRYAAVAEGWLGAVNNNFLARTLAFAAQAGQRVQSYGSTVSEAAGAVRHFVAHRQLADDAQRQLMLRFVEGDVIDTVAASAELVLHDQDIDTAARVGRARLLLLFSEALLATARPEEAAAPAPAQE